MSTAPSVIEVRPLEITADWLVPEADDDPVTDRVAAANGRLRVDAQTRLARLLPSAADSVGWDPPRPTRPSVIDINTAELGVDHREVVDTLMSVEDASGARVVMSRSGQPTHLPLGPSQVHPRQHPDRSPSRLSAAGLVAALYSGSSIIFNHSDDLHPVLGALASDFGRAFACQVSINTYVSVGGTGAQGFGGHWDEQDVIAIPLIGEKEWSVAEPLDTNPLLAAVPQGHSEHVVLERSLRPGQAIVVPRGWTHRVQHGTGGLSVHLTIGLVRIRGPALLSQLTQRLLRFPSFRADVSPGDPTHAICEFLLQRVDAQELGAAAALCYARFGSRRFDSLTALLSFLAGDVEDLWVGSTASTLIMVERARDSEGRVILGLDNRAVAVPESKLADVLELLAGPARCLLDDSTDPSVVEQLVMGGLLDVTRGQPRSWLR